MVDYCNNNLPYNRKERDTVKSMSSNESIENFGFENHLLEACELC